MRQEQFKREHEDSLVILKCYLPTHGIGLALDTGASHTTIDMTALQIAGYDISQAHSITKIETAAGIIEAYLIKLKEFTALGITRKNFTVCAYDFFAYHVLTDFDGVLGLDFVDEYKLCIDFRNSVVTLI
jgi:Aspartyl protease